MVDSCFFTQCQQYCIIATQMGNCSVQSLPAHHIEMHTELASDSIALQRVKCLCGRITQSRTSQQQPPAHTPHIIAANMFAFFVIVAHLNAAFSSHSFAIVLIAQAINFMLKQKHAENAQSLFKRR